MNFAKSHGIIDNSKKESQNNTKIIEKMENYIKKINGDNFINTIKIILTSIIIGVLAIYIIIINYQEDFIDLIHKTFQCYYYNLYSKNLILHFQTVIIEKFYNISEIGVHNFTTEENYTYMITDLTPLLKENFHYFTNSYYEYNLNIDHDFKLMFERRKFKRLFGKWEEDIYFMDFPTEMDSIIYNVYYTLDLNQNETKSDINNFLFRKGIIHNDNKTKIYTNYIKIIYYFIVNYELTWKYIFDEVDESIKESFTAFANIKMRNFYIMEILGLLLFIIFFLISMMYLYFSNDIIIKNIIFLFLDFSDDKTKTLKNNNTKIMMIKLIEFKTCINDFSLEQLNIYANNLGNIQENQNSPSFLKAYTGFNSTFGKDDTIKRANSNKKDSILSIKNIEEGLNKKESLKEKHFVREEQSTISNSSVHYLNKSSSTFLKEKLNRNNSNFYSNQSQASTVSNNIGSTNNQSMNVSIKHISNKNENNKGSNRVYKQSENNSYNINNNKNINLNNENEPIQDIILDKSNKNFILIIKIYSVIIYILLSGIIAYSIFKIINTVNYHNNYENIFYVFNLITNRYLLLNYYYNTLKSLIIFPIEEQSQSLENFLVHFEELNGQYNRIGNNLLNHLSDIKDLYGFIKDSNLNSTDLMYNSLCNDKELCIKYIFSSSNIMDAGIDFIYKSILIDVSKSYLDYKNLKNQSDIETIKKLIVNPHFLDSGLFIEYAYYYIKSAIFEGFKNDETNYKNKFENNMKYLNLIMLIFAIFSFIYVVIFVFITITNFGEPIKRSAYRISCSFYFIKKYNIFNYRKSTSH